MKKVQITASVRPHLAEWLREEAEANHQSLSLQVDRVLEEAKQRAEGTLTTTPAKAKPGRKPAAKSQDTAEQEPVKDPFPNDFWKVPETVKDPLDGRRFIKHPPGSPVHDAMVREQAGAWLSSQLEPGPMYDMYVRFCEYLGETPKPPVQPKVLTPEEEARGAEWEAKYGQANPWWDGYDDDGEDSSD